MDFKSKAKLRFLNMRIQVEKKRCVKLGNSHKYAIKIKLRDIST